MPGRRNAIALRCSPTSGVPRPSRICRSTWCSTRAAKRRAEPKRQAPYVRGHARGRSARWPGLKRCGCCASPAATSGWPAVCWIQRWRKPAGAGQLSSVWRRPSKPGCTTSAARHLRFTPPSTHDISRLLLLLQEAGIEIKPLLPHWAFTSFAGQDRYHDEPEELCLDRSAWCDKAEALIEQVEGLLG